MNRFITWHKLHQWFKKLSFIQWNQAIDDSPHVQTIWMMLCWEAIEVIQLTFQKRMPFEGILAVNGSYAY